MNKWSHLPNAHLIDWVLKSLKTDPNAWDAAWEAAYAVGEAAYATAWDAAWDAAWEYGRMTAWDAARDAAREAARDARDAARGAAREYGRMPAWDAAMGAILALIADDNAAQYLHIKLDKLKVWAILSEKPAAVLLIPANKIWQREHARAENALQYN